MEKEILVKDISELQTGDRIILKPARCNIHNKHKYMVFTPFYGTHNKMKELNIKAQSGYELLPIPSCKSYARKVLVFPHDIDRKVVYKLIDDTEESISNTKELELVK